MMNSLWIIWMVATCKLTQAVSKPPLYEMVVSVHKNRYSTGGTYFGGAKSARKCIEHCHGFPGCMTVDFNSKQKKCYRHLEDTGCRKTHTLKQIVQYKLVKCVKNGIGGGIVIPGLQNLRDCLEGCRAHVGCKATDYLLTEKGTNGTCSFHSASQSCPDNPSNKSITVSAPKPYFQRGFLFTNCSIPVPTADYLSDNIGFRIAGGSLQRKTLSSEQCLLLCHNTSGCRAVDYMYNVEKKGAESCWFHFDASNCNMLESCDTCLHFKFITCSTDSYLPGGHLQMTMNSVADCVEGCQNISEQCSAIDFDHEGNTCRFHKIDKVCESPQTMKMSSFHRLVSCNSSDASNDSLDRNIGLRGIFAEISKFESLLYSTTESSELLQGSTPIDIEGFDNGNSFGFPRNPIPGGTTTASPPSVFREIDNRFAFPRQLFPGAGTTTMSSLEARKSYDTTEPPQSSQNKVQVLKETLYFLKQQNGLGGTFDATINKLKKVIKSLSELQGVPPTLDSFIAQVPVKDFRKQAPTQRQSRPTTVIRPTMRYREPPSVVKPTPTGRSKFLANQETAHVWNQLAQSTGFQESGLDLIMNHHIPGGVAKGNLKTFESCLNYCQSMGNICKAFDYNFSHRSCHLHTFATACMQPFGLSGCLHVKRFTCDNTADTTTFNPMLLAVASPSSIGAHGINEAPRDLNAGKVVPNGRLQSGISTFDQCFRMCEFIPTCRALDFDTNEKTCLFHSPTTACNNMEDKESSIHVKSITCTGQQSHLQNLINNHRSNLRDTPRFQAPIYESSRASPPPQAQPVRDDLSHREQAPQSIGQLPQAVVDEFDNSPRFVVNIHGTGGAIQSGIDKFDVCFTICIHLDSCLEMDFNFNTKMCYFHDSGSACGQMIPRSAAMHVSKQTCADIASPISGSILDQSALGGGVPQPAYTNLPSCLLGCITLQSCLALDFSYTQNACYFHEARTSCGELISRAASVHFRRMSCS